MDQKFTVTEEWRDVVGYEGTYQISSMGNIKKTYPTEKHLTPTRFKGYESVILFKPQSRKRHRIHRLVATAFIENTFNKPEVNHKNGIKWDNRVDNLEWCTGEENRLHAVLTLRKSTLKLSYADKKRSFTPRVYAYLPDGSFHGCYSHMTSAATALRITIGQVESAIKRGSHPFGLTISKTPISNPEISEMVDPPKPPPKVYIKKDPLDNMVIQRRIPVFAYTLSGIFIKKYESIFAAAKDLSIRLERIR